MIGAITLSAVHLQVVNRDFWPDYPWAEIADTYDLILPMTYWTIRLPEWRDGYRYVSENIDRIRAATGDPDIPIHVIGGIADEATVEQVQGMLQAIDGPRRRHRREPLRLGHLVARAVGRARPAAGPQPRRRRRPMSPGGRAVSSRVPSERRRRPRRGPGSSASSTPTWSRELKRSSATDCRSGA